MIALDTNVLIYACDRSNHTSIFVIFQYPMRSSFFMAVRRRPLLGQRVPNITPGA